MNKDKILPLIYAVPVLLIAAISISHVKEWYALTNPNSWASYLSIAIELAALSGVLGMAIRHNKYVYVPFFVVTLIQLIGNSFYCYQYIDETGNLFKDWVDFSNPFFDLVGMESDVNSHKRFLSYIAGGLLSLISLTFLHLLVKTYQEINEEEKNKEILNHITPIIVEKSLEEDKIVIDDSIIEKEVIIDDNKLDINGEIFTDVLPDDEEAKPLKFTNDVSTIEDTPKLDDINEEQLKQMNYMERGFSVKIPELNQEE